MTTRQRASKSKESGKKPLYTIGVLSDTHIPDKVNELHPLILPTLRAAGVSHIFHAGDICSSRVLQQLQEIAPVTAVRGNRDWFVRGIPMIKEMEIGGVKIALMHGHGGILHYLVDKVRYLFYPYNIEHYQKFLPQFVPEAKVIIFGHTHICEAYWLDEKLLFNPGSASFGSKRNQPPTMGFLKIYENGIIKPNIIYLKKYRVRKRQWVLRTQP
jgi:putative phosphoesterase